MRGEMNDITLDDRGDYNPMALRGTRKHPEQT